MKDCHQQMTIPHLFMCPISLDLFTDPVTLCTGQTYDRPSIEKWLASGNLTCPVTMQKLQDPSLVPNHTLRHLIDQWRHIGTHFDPSVKLLAALKHNLESQETSPETKIQLLERLQVLIEGSGSRLIQDLELLPLLLKLVSGEVNVKLIEQALVCVLRLIPFTEKGSINTLLEESKLDSFRGLLSLKNATDAIKTSLCSLVEALSAFPELCAKIGESNGLLREIVLLVSHNSEASSNGVMAISALCSLRSNRVYLVQEGAVNGLVAYILSTEKSKNDAAPLAVSALEKLLEVEGAKEHLIKNPNGVYALVRMVFKVSDHEGSESAVSALTEICSDSLDAREEAIGAGVLTQLLLLLQSQCNGRTKTKARVLLKMLKSKWSEDTKHVCRYK